MMKAEKYYGKYRGTVVNNIDPEQRGRIQAMVPDVLGLTPSNWALPSLPIAGMQQGTFMIPQQGSGIWIEFEQGDPDYPIWVGCFWGSAAEVPLMALAASPLTPPIVFQSTTQNKIVISSVPGDGIKIETVLGIGGPFIQINDTGVYISDGKGGSIAIAGGTVVVNQGALIIK